MYVPRTCSLPSPSAVVLTTSAKELSQKIVNSACGCWLPWTMTTVGSDITLTGTLSSPPKFRTDWKSSVNFSSITDWGGRGEKRKKGTWHHATGPSHFAVYPHFMSTTILRSLYSFQLLQMANKCKAPPTPAMPAPPTPAMPAPPTRLNVHVSLSVFCTSMTFLLFRSSPELKEGSILQTKYAHVHEV